MKLVEHPQEAGFEVWVDTEIHYGTRWENEVRRQIETAAAMVVVMTPDAERSEHVGNELIWARRLKIRSCRCCSPARASSRFPTGIISTPGTAACPGGRS